MGTRANPREPTPPPSEHPRVLGLQARMYILEERVREAANAAAINTAAQQMQDDHCCPGIKPGSQIRCAIQFKETNDRLQDHADAPDAHDLRFIAHTDRLDIVEN